jgi:molecular chaperone GrpE
MWERVNKLSSTNNDAVRVTLSQDSKEISEKLKQSQETIDSETESDSNNTIDESPVIEEADDQTPPEQATDNNQNNDSDMDEEEPKSEEKETKQESPEEKLEKTASENKDLQDRLLRLSAEFENFKKRNRREMTEFKKFASEVLIKDLLPVLDSLDRALETTSSDDACKAINEGVSMTRDEMLKVFSKYGVKPIEALEKEFDPAFHQAVGQEEDAESPKNTVLKEFQKGYTIHGRLLRPSMVIVSS